MAACRGCGAALVWIRTEAGKSMPLNVDMKKYYLASDVVDGKVRDGVKPIFGYASHWSTCPKRELFKKPQAGG